MPLIGMFEARRFRLQAAEGGVGVGGSGKAGGGGFAACRLRHTPSSLIGAFGFRGRLCTNDTDGW